ncbi:MAG: hypothetical protein EON94_07965 [Caulobacteraceae bacterium]|nr:MAG: hypothetical protein EON94_07965 [Caulobacteraceae bacterium]
MDWSRLLQVEPPSRLRILWQIAPDRTPQPDPAQASEIELVFTSTPSGGTEVPLTHDAFERCGEAGADYRTEMASEYGWPLILAKFTEHALKG